MVPATENYVATQNYAVSYKPICNYPANSLLTYFHFEQYGNYVAERSFCSFPQRDTFFHRVFHSRLLVRPTTTQPVSLVTQNETSGNLKISRRTRNNKNESTKNRYRVQKVLQNFLHVKPPAYLTGRWNKKNNYCRCTS